VNPDWSNLAYNAEDNLGGNRMVRCANLERISYLQGPTSYNIIEVAPDWVNGIYTWIDILFRQDSSSFSERHSPGTGGPEWRIQVKGFKAYDSADDRSQLEDMVRRQWVVHALDNNNVYRRLGDLRNPARLTIDFDTESAITGSRGYTLTWTWENDRPAAIVQTDRDNDGTYTEADFGDVIENPPDDDV